MTSIARIERRSPCDWHDGERALRKPLRIHYRSGSTIEIELSFPSPSCCRVQGAEGHIALTVALADDFTFRNPVRDESWPVFKVSLWSSSAQAALAGLNGNAVASRDGEAVFELVWRDCGTARIPCSVPAKLYVHPALICSQCDVPSPQTVRADRARSLVLSATKRFGSAFGGRVGIAKHIWAFDDPLQGSTCNTCGRVICCDACVQDTLRCGICKDITCGVCKLFWHCEYCKEADGCPNRFCRFEQYAEDGAGLYCTDCAEPFP